MVASVAVHGLVFAWAVYAPHGSTSAGAASAVRMLVVTREHVPSEPVPVDPVPPVTPAVPTAAPKPAPVPDAGRPVDVVAPTPQPSASSRTLAPAPGYHTSQGLNPPPQFLNEIEPQYPAGAALLEGSVVLRFLISASGEVEDVAVVRSTPPGIFEEAALRAYSKARFSPGYLLGIPVRSQKTIEVLFTPINRGGGVDATSSTAR